MTSNVVHIKNYVLAAIAAVGAFAGEALGGWDSMMKLLVALMGMDILTGCLVAAVWKRSNKSESGALNSRSGFKGLCRKCMILLMVWLGVLLDNAIGSTYVRNMIVIFFVGNEGLSLLENLGLMGVPYPDFLKKALEVLHDHGNKGSGGDKTM